MNKLSISKKKFSINAKEANLDHIIRKKTNSISENLRKSF